MLRDVHSKSRQTSIRFRRVITCPSVDTGHQSALVNRLQFDPVLFDFGAIPGGNKSLAEGICGAAAIGCS